MPDNKLEDQSSDRKYFMVTPQLVWAICRSPYDYTLWDVIKMIAGENGECYLSTEDLAILSMMSTGKVSQCRKFLIENGLLKGEIRRDPGYPQPVWHLQIPDIWKENVTWRQEFDSLADRITLKREQKKSLHPVKPSPFEEPPSLGEGGISPDEEPPSPDETKKNQVVNLKEEREEEPNLLPISKNPNEDLNPAIDGHQRAIDGNPESHAEVVMRHYYGGWMGCGPVDVPKKEREKWRQATITLLDGMPDQQRNTELLNLCQAVDEVCQSDLDGFWSKMPCKHENLDLVRKAIVARLARRSGFRQSHVIEKPPRDEVDELYDWWDSQVAYSYRFKGWLKKVIPISRKNGTVTIDISNASDQQRLESLLVTIASGLPDVDRLEIVER